LFAGLPPDPELAMLVLLTPSHFRPPAFFLRAVRVRRGEYVADASPAAFSPSWGLHPAGVLPVCVGFSCWVGVLVACLLLACSLSLSSCFSRLPLALVPWAIFGLRGFVTYTHWIEAFCVARITIVAHAPSPSTHLPLRMQSRRCAAIS